MILASGFSERFGNDNKLLMPLKHKTVIETTVSHVRQSYVAKDLIVVTQYEEIKDLFDGIDEVKVCMNLHPDKGISQSVIIGVEATTDVSGYMFIPGDQVCLSAKSIEALSKVFDANPGNIVIPVYGGRYGSPKIFPQSMREALLSLKGDEGGRTLIKTHRDKVIELVIDDLKENEDIDTLVDYNRIREVVE